jgi:Protein of unknown function (Hypoth_ymh)
VTTIDGYLEKQEKLLAAVVKPPTFPPSEPSALGLTLTHLTHRPDPEQSLAYGVHPVLAGEPYELVSSGNPMYGLHAGWNSLKSWLYEQWPQLGGYDGEKLAAATFRPDHGCVRLADTTTDTGRSIQEGVFNLALAAVKLIRNPTAHGRAEWAPSSTNERDYARNALALLNTLCWWVQAGIN